MAEKTTPDKPPESPTTARELDFDDDNDAPTASALTESTTAPPPPAKSPKPSVRFQEDARETPPEMPLRPHEQAEKTMQLMFPNQNPETIRLVLRASGYKVQTAVDAILGESEPPNVEAEEIPPPKPPRPQRSQLEQDEIYARQLAEHYQRQDAQHGQAAYGSRSRGDDRRQPRPQDSNREPSFFDDELPEIRKNIEQGFKETQKTVTGWINTLAKKLDGEPEEYDRYGNPVYPGRQERPSGRQNFGPSQSEQLHGIRRSAEQRRSAEHSRYDADNRVLDDDFAKLEMRDNDGPPPRTSSRPNANPDLFKSTPVAPPQSGPVDEVDALYRNPSPNGQSNSQNKSGGKKWQPLTSVAPHPEPDDHDPFSLGDSDDDESKAKDTNPADTERLKKAASNKEGTAAAELKPAERSGSVSQKDATAEALLKDTK